MVESVVLGIKTLHAGESGACKERELRPAPLIYLACVWSFLAATCDIVLLAQLEERIWQ